MLQPNDSQGYYTTIVDPAGTDFALHIVKNSLDHAACTRPALPSTEVTEAEKVTFTFAPSIIMGAAVTTLACWRSNFELETPILFEQQPDVVVDVASRSFSLNISKGDYWTISTVRTATHGKFATKVPASQPRAPMVVDNFNSYPDRSQQPKYWMQMTGSFEVHVDDTNTSNMVLRQTATQISLDNWGGRFSYRPATVFGMREWQDVKIATRFRLPLWGGAPAWPASSAGMCVATRVGWVYECGVVLCIDASGQWNLTTSGRVSGKVNLTGHVRSPPHGGTWHSISLTTLGATATATYDDSPLFTNTPVPDYDTGFAGLSTTGYYAVEYDEVAVSAVGPNWKVNPTPPAACMNATVGHVIAARRCVTNGITANDQAFELISQSWQIRHISTQLCVTAASGSVGAVITLQKCNFSEPLQQWKNDYSNIHHDSYPLTLIKANLSLGGDTDGIVVTVSVGSSVFGKRWSTWTYMDSTHQLRNTRAPGPATGGYPMCLALCKDS